MSQPAAAYQVDYSVRHDCMDRVSMQWLDMLCSWGLSLTVTYHSFIWWLTFPWTRVWLSFMTMSPCCVSKLKQYFVTI